MKICKTEEKKTMKEKVLQVKTFGSCSMTYGDKSLFGRKVGETQFASLMQLLIHNRKDGVSREQMEEVLFGEREVENVHHALQSVIYNAKTRLKKAGLPDVNYIEIKNGIVSWTKEIKVQEDATEFERLYKKAEKEKDAEKKLEELEKIFKLYTGEFLATRQSVIWVAIEARRYEEMFRECVEEAANLYREQQKYTQLESLGRYAANIEPFSDWEALTMEAMVALGRYEEATDLYADTAERYFEERGLKPSKRLLDSLNQLGNQVIHSYEVLDNIQNNLDEKDREEKKGAYLCSYPTFQGIYQHLVRMLERSGQSLYLMLCTIVDSKGKPMKEGATLEGLAERLEKAICSSIRSSDVVNHYSKGQYLVLLINTTREDCTMIQKRINYHFLTERQRTGVRYYVNSVVYEKDF